MTKEIPLGKIYSTGNVRNEKDEDIKDLMNSINKNGLLQPILVRADHKGKYEIVAGHRRYLACKNLGLPTIECKIAEDYTMDSDMDKLVVQVTENIQRKEMSALEIVEICEKLKKKGYTARMVAQLFNKPEHYIYGAYDAKRKLLAMYNAEDEHELPEEARKLKTGAIQSRSKTAERKYKMGKGFRLCIKGHCYTLTFSDFVAEERFNKWLEGKLK